LSRVGYESARAEAALLVLAFAAAPAGYDLRGGPTPGRAWDVSGTPQANAPHQVTRTRVSTGGMDNEGVPYRARTPLRTATTGLQPRTPATTRSRPAPLDGIPGAVGRARRCSTCSTRANAVSPCPPAGVGGGGNTSTRLTASGLSVDSGDSPPASHLNPHPRGSSGTAPSRSDRHSRRDLSRCCFSSIAAVSARRRDAPFHAKAQLRPVASNAAPQARCA
jgi:hypothetical protein